MDFTDILLNVIREGEKKFEDIVIKTEKRDGGSRGTINTKLNQLVKSGIVSKKGRTKGDTEYSLNKDTPDYIDLSKLQQDLETNIKNLVLNARKKDLVKIQQMSKRKKKQIVKNGKLLYFLKSEIEAILNLQTSLIFLMAIEKNTIKISKMQKIIVDYTKAIKRDIEVARAFDEVFGHLLEYSIKNIVREKIISSEKKHYESYKKAERQLKELEKVTMN